MDTLDALRLYVSIADAGNLTAAARQQSVATSTVTVALQQLEAQAGASLIRGSTFPQFHFASLVIFGAFLFVIS